MSCAHCLNADCEYNDISFEDNCSAPEEICNKCDDADWDDEADLHIAAVSLGCKGGKVKSDRKAKSSAANGRKGGRPKKEKIEKKEANMNPLTLRLTLYAEYFSAILAGTKNIECRRRSERYDKQFQKPYTHIKFINGYGNHRPWLLIEIKRFEKTDDQWLIHLGSVLESGNIKPTLFS